MPDDEAMQIEAIPFHAMALPQPLRFPPPYAHLSTAPDGFAHHWQLLTFAFDLPDPSRFPPFPEIDDAQCAVLRRYVDTCKELATYGVLSHTGGVTVVPDEDRVELDLPAPDSVRGAVTLFRQLYATEEAASYNAVRKILGELANQQDDEHRDQRREWLRAWKRAQGALLQRSLEVIVSHRVIQQRGWHPDTRVPFEDVRPTVLISQFQYGELIHWGERREELQALLKDEVTGALHKVEFLKVMLGLSHFYLGFSVLVEAAYRRREQ